MNILIRIKVDFLTFLDFHDYFTQEYFFMAIFWYRKILSSLFIIVLILSIR